MSEWKLVITGDGEVRDAEGRLLDGEGNVQEPQALSDEKEDDLR